MAYGLNELDYPAGCVVFDPKKLKGFPGLQLGPEIPAPRLPLPI